MPSYNERLMVFAARSTTFEKVMIQDGNTVGWWVKGGPDKPCDCCGFQRLKVRYVLVGDDETLYFVGGECVKRLHAMGKSKSVVYSRIVELK